MTTNDIDAIRARSVTFQRMQREARPDRFSGRMSAADVPALCDEVEQLRAAQAVYSRAVADAQQERDEFREEAVTLTTELADVRAALDHATRELAGTRADRDSAVKANTAWANQAQGNERAIKHVQGLLEYLEQGDYRPLAEDEVANLALDFKAILADLGRPVIDDDERPETRAVETVALPGVSL
ncbi:hypothetical protein [Micromonospora sp. NPDC023644]|uniref:hypothetical protein n=1 Tax=Micromonospora sp. NPDC023644 TaxID=3154321 RepID=UPI0033DBEA68